MCCSNPHEVMYLLKPNTLLSQEDAGSHPLLAIGYMGPKLREMKIQT